MAPSACTAWRRSPVTLRTDAPYRFTCPETRSRRCPEERCRICRARPGHSVATSVSDRCLLPPVRQLGGSGFDCVQFEFAALPVGREAAKAIDFRVSAGLTGVMTARLRLLAPDVSCGASCGAHCTYSVTGHLCAWSGGRSHVGGVDQLVIDQRRFAQHSEPAKWIDPLVFAAHRFRDCPAVDTVKSGRIRQRSHSLSDA